MSFWKRRYSWAQLLALPLTLYILGGILLNLFELCMVIMLKQGDHVYSLQKLWGLSKMFYIKHLECLATKKKTHSITIISLFRLFFEIAKIWVCKGRNLKYSRRQRRELLWIKTQSRTERHKHWQHWGNRLTYGTILILSLSFLNCQISYYEVLTTFVLPFFLKL